METATTERNRRRKNLFKEPQELWDKWVEYREKTKKEVIKIHKVHGAHSASVYEERDHPLTWVGFKTFLADQDDLYGGNKKTFRPRNLAPYIREGKSEYKLPEFFPVTDAIREEINDHNDIRLMVGMYNRATARCPMPTEEFPKELTEEPIVARPIFPKAKELPKD